MFELMRKHLCIFTALTTLSQIAAATELFCGSAVVDQRGLMLGWTLNQPTESQPFGSTHFPTRIHVAFSKDTLFISDDRETVAVDPRLPHHISHRVAGQVAFLHAGSTESIVYPGNTVFEIHEAQIPVRDDAKGLPFLEPTKTLLVDKLVGKRQTRLLSYSHGPTKRIAYLAASPDRESGKLWVVVMKQAGDKFVFEYELELPPVQDKGTPLYVATNKDLSAILLGEVTQEEIRLTMKRGAEILPVQIISHKIEKPLSGVGGVNSMVVSDKGNTLLLGSLLVTNAFQKDLTPSVLALSENSIGVAAFSPDGNYLAYHQNTNTIPTGRNPMVVFNVFTRQAARSIHLDGMIRSNQMAFSKDGQHLAVVGYSAYPRNLNNRALLQLFKMQNLLAHPEPRMVEP